MRGRANTKATEAAEYFVDHGGINVGRIALFDYEGLKAFKRIDTYRWTDRDAILYALSLGVGRDLLNTAELPFVYEGSGLRLLPTFPTAMVRYDFLDGFGVDTTGTLHGEAGLTLHRPMFAAGEVNVETTVNEIYDKGESRGALISIESHGVCAETGEPVFTVLNHTFARANGGFGGPRGAPRQYRAPDRNPDLTVRTETRPDQTLLYRLNGDRNALHADPAVARDAGYPRPILHGLCTYGIAGWIVTSRVCDYDESRIAAIDVRFTAPLYPGEPLEFDLWIDGDVVSFRCRAPERGITGLDAGRCVLRGPA